MRDRVRVPVADVIGAEAREQEVQERLLRLAVRFEGNRGASSAWSGRKDEGDDELAIGVSADECPTCFVVALRPNSRDELAQCTPREYASCSHQNRSPVSIQRTYSTSHAHSTGTMDATVPRSGSQRSRCTHTEPSAYT